MKHLTAAILAIICLGAAFGGGYLAGDRNSEARYEHGVYDGTREGERRGEDACRRRGVL